MAGNILSVLLNFKPNLDGLNRFVAGYKARMDQVEAFNKRIQNGEVALRGMMGRLAGVLGVAAMYQYANAAREAEAAQNELTQALRRTGQVQYLNSLIRQSQALEEVTKFSQSAIQAVQRTTLSFGLSAEQVEATTEAILDFAQNTQQSAEGAARFFGQALMGGKEDLARYNIELDTSKDRVTALVEAMQKTSGGAARAAVVNKEEHALMVQYGRETEKLGMIARAVAVPFLQALIPALRETGASIAWLAGILQPFAGVFGETSGSVLRVVLVVGLLSGSITALKMVINPLRSAIVLLTGVTLTQYVRAIDTVIAKQGLMRTSIGMLGNGLTSMSGALRLAGVAGMMYFAWEIGVFIGKLINELNIGGAKVKDWVTLVVGEFMALGTKLWAAVKKSWNYASLAFTSAFQEIKALVLEFLIWVGDKFNNALGRRLGFTVDTAGFKESLAATRKEMLDAAREVATENEWIDLQAGRSADAYRSAGREILTEGKQQAAASATAAPGDNLADFNPEALEAQMRRAETARKAAEEAQLARRRELYLLETQAQQAEADGDIARADAIRRQLREMEALADLGEDARDLVAERLDLEDKVTQQKRDQQAASDAQSVLEKQLNRLQSERQIAEQRGDRTGALRILTQEMALIEQIIKTYKDAAAAATTDLGRAEARAQIAQWQQLLDDLQRNANASKLSQADQNYKALSDPRQHFQDIGEGAQGGLLEYLAQVGTMADQVANGIKNTLGTAVSSISAGIVDWINGTVTFGQMAQQIGNTILQSMLKTVIDMGVQWLVNKVLVMTGMTAIETAADTHRVARVAKENAAEAATLPAKTAGAVAAGISSFGVALAFGAVALAAIMAAFGAFETGGKVRGGEQLIRVNERGEETVINAGATRRFGDAFMAGLNNGQLLLDALPADVANSLAMPGAQAAQGGAAGAGAAGGSAPQAVNVAIFDRASNARDWLDSSEGQRYLHDRVKNIIRDLS